ncbi:hypothetical protein [Gemmatimonas sp.]|uniref:hypothetical protein n=1 Tax=Gemmatimonas sp. TaxID=1962908 RepID=UPI0027B89161|nr:hypothetical protein [Gemmatimonas sp.]
MDLNPPIRPRPKADPMRIAKLLEAVDVLSEESKRLPPDNRLRVILALNRIRDELGLL